MIKLLIKSSLTIYYQLGSFKFYNTICKTDRLNNPGMGSDKIYVLCSLISAYTVFILLVNWLAWYEDFEWSVRTASIIGVGI